MKCWLVSDNYVSCLFSCLLLSFWRPFSGLTWVTSSLSFLLFHPLVLDENLWEWVAPVFYGLEDQQCQSTVSALYSIAFGTHKNGWTDQYSVRVISVLGPRISELHGGDDPRRRKGTFGGNFPNKLNTPMNCKLDWSMQQLSHDRGRHLIASVGWVYYRPQRGWYCTLRAKSDIYDCLVVLCTSWKSWLSTDLWLCYSQILTVLLRYFKQWHCI